MQLIKRYLSEGRNVYVDGIDGLQPFGWESCDARNWEALPDGSVIVVNEAQKVWPTRSGSSAIPPEIRALSEHRHRGFDFVLLTQHPTMLDAYVRRLVGEHEHVLRQFGMQASRIVTWTECQDDPQSLGTRQRGTVALWKYPTDCYPLYKSATLHTVKRKLPFRVLMIPVLILAVAALAWWGTNSVRRRRSAGKRRTWVQRPIPSRIQGGRKFVMRRRRNTLRRSFRACRRCRGRPRHSISAKCGQSRASFA